MINLDVFLLGMKKIKVSIKERAQKRLTGPKSFLTIKSNQKIKNVRGFVHLKQKTATFFGSFLKRARLVSGLNLPKLQVTGLLAFTTH